MKVRYAFIGFGAITFFYLVALILVDSLDQIFTVFPKLLSVLITLIELIDSFDCKSNPAMLMRAEERHGFDLTNSIMIGDKDSDMQAANSAGVVGAKFNYLADGHERIQSSTATHKTHSLQDGISLLGESVCM